MTNKSREDIERRFVLLRSDPVKYIEETSELVDQSPNDAHAYFIRHFGWIELGQLQRALDDLDRSLERKVDPVGLKSRGLLFMRLGRLHDAAADFSRAWVLDPEEWKEIWGLLYQAHCHALLGEEDAALAACDALPDDHWSPGLHGAPGGNKEQVIERIRQTLSALPNRKE